MSGSQRHWLLKRQSWSFGAELASAAAVVVCLILREPVWALAFGAAAVAFALLNSKWAAVDPMPLPYEMRWILLLPRPFQSARQLRDRGV